MEGVPSNCAYILYIASILLAGARDSRVCCVPERVANVRESVATGRLHCRLVEVNHLSSDTGNSKNEVK